MHQGKKIMLPKNAALWKSVVVALCLVWTSQHVVWAQPPAPTSVAACTLIISPEVEVVDGKTNYADVEPGDTLCIPAGSRESIEIRNLRGEAGAPITIRNHGGQVRIQGGTFRHGITLENNTHLRLTGTGVSDRCGAPYAVAEQQCGFVITGFSKAIEAINNPSNIEYDHIEATQSRDAAFKVKGDGKRVANHYVHHVYAHDISKEGLYMGESGEDGDINLVRGLEVSYNLVVRSGWDAINVKHTAGEVRVHHNVVLGSGLAGEMHQDQGLSIGAGGTGDYYNNTIMDAYGPGLNIRELPAGSNVYNNVIANSGKEGIRFSDGNDVRFFNNTLVNNQQAGINAAPHAAGEAFNNVIVGSPVAIEGANIRARDNFTGTVDAARFVDAQGEDFRLQNDSPLIDGGRASGTLPPFDRLGRPRTQGAKPDQGAYEFAGTPAPTVTDRSAWPVRWVFAVLVGMLTTTMLLFTRRSHTIGPPRPSGTHTTASLNRWRNNR